MRRLRQAAHEIATAPVERTQPAQPTAPSEPTEVAQPVDLVEPLIDMIEAQRAIEASAVVLRRANEVEDSVLKILGS